ncbi:DNA-binding protein Rfx5 [Caerostris extrusa]|uniref:DNA-binding protein Rfx5 n=1 Tax=Caerostris extrusa TaxID=172846 RepID=A0AAV4NTY1_CAEEX|nr:DNA-binding protein Rfx5 [Caerostris extrusa]
MEYVNRQVYTSNSGRVNTYTQVPSVPQSPNTRRRAFNFMPISPRHTPVPENLNSTPKYIIACTKSVS